MAMLVEVGNKGPNPLVLLVVEQFNSTLDKAALKVVNLAIEHISKKWTMPIREGKPALNRFAIEFEHRFPEGIIL